jgi:ABC-type sugar transport system ATPase subunit
MSLLRDWVVEEGGVLASAMGRIAAPETLASQLHAGQQVILGFHSEAGRVIVGEEVPEGELAIRGQVINCEPNFARHFQVVNVQAANIIFSVDAPLDMPINAGWPVRVVIPPQRMYLFDQESETRLAPPG